ncbi:alcohol dehydrogenase [Photobacterium jeanii]|uniref:Alcohol dehydrogenase n=1 Tax=Photobacterium jeanii TaxID=858640 RepID=A0A178K8B3_9GAMM|nr:nucleotidyltransferase family protein [Photobacterium jeanii]OAN13551.1 alcohol dehydrogenase [Photobacterium jeanii]PST88666.1 alcohol dehydrogenase [Photobacterium jeanii]
MIKNWKKAVLPPSATLREALAVIDAQALRIALIADHQMTLLGTVTDGDLRRGLLRGLDMSSPVTEVMNTSPITASASLSHQALATLMEAKDILAVPLLDNGILTGLKTLNQVLHPVQHDNPVFLMAGGFGTRLQPLTNACPKPMLKVGDKPILESILQSFIQAGFRHFYISTHYLPDMIRAHFGKGEKWGVSITYVHEEQPLGTGGALGLLPDDISKLPMIMMNGDIMTNLDFTKLLDFHHQQGADATMCVREYEYQIPFGVIDCQGGAIHGLSEKPAHKVKVNTGIYVLNHDVVRQVEKNQRIDITDVFSQVIATKGKAASYEISEYWLDIGRIDDYRRAQADMMDMGIF